MRFAEVSLSEMLLARENRANRQRKLQEETKLPLLSFTMNIAGPVKRSFPGDFLFHQTISDLKKLLGKPINEFITEGDTGCEAIFVYDVPEQKLKEIAIGIEEDTPSGRLLDLDVIGKGGNIISRAEKRSCIICGKPGAECARSRAHSVPELQNKTAELLREYGGQRIAQLAVSALKEEALLTPKPGLVDQKDSGAHKDMDISLMLKSADSLHDYFKHAALLGQDCIEGSFFEASQELQRRGIQAEKDMLHTTEGVNTHKGAVYGLGLLCFGAGMYVQNGCDAVKAAAAAASSIPEGKENSHGMAVRNRYGIKGARDEATGGFKTAAGAAASLKKGYDPIRVLLRIMNSIDDTNVYWRSGEEGAIFLKDKAENLLKITDDKDLLRALAETNHDFIKRDISPGGAADILAQALFINKLLYKAE